MHHPTDRITHTRTLVIPVVEHWLKWEINHRGKYLKGAISGRKEFLFYLTMHSIHFRYGYYDVGHMVEYCESGNPLQIHLWLLLPIFYVHQPMDGKVRSYISCITLVGTI